LMPDGTGSTVTTVLRGPESNRRLEVMLATTTFVAASGDAFVVWTMPSS
jgi:hypothetical protein